VEQFALTIPTKGAKRDPRGTQRQSTRWGGNGTECHCSTWNNLVLASVALNYQKMRYIVPRGTIVSGIGRQSNRVEYRKLFHVEQFVLNLKNHSIPSPHFHQRPQAADLSNVIEAVT